MLFGSYLNLSWISTLTLSRAQFMSAEEEIRLMNITNFLIIEHCADILLF